MRTDACLESTHRAHSRLNLTCGQSRIDPAPWAWVLHSCRCVMTSDPERRDLVVTGRDDVGVRYLRLMDDFLARLNRAFDDLLSIPQSRDIYRPLPEPKRRAPRPTTSRTPATLRPAPASPDK